MKVERQPLESSLSANPLRKLVFQQSRHSLDVKKVARGKNLWRGMVLEPVEHGGLADIFGLVVDIFERLVDGGEHSVVGICRVQVLHDLVVLIDNARQDACVIAAGDELVNGLVVDSVVAV